MSSNNGWIYDSDTGQWVAWSAEHRSWLNASRERVRPPRQSSGSAEAPTSSSRGSAVTSSSPRGSTSRTTPSNASRGSGSLPTIESSMAQMSISPSSSSSRYPLPPSTSTSRNPTSSNTNTTTSTAQSYSATHRDPTTGIETRWEVSGSSQYTDPVNSSQRSLNLKRIRETGNQRDARSGSTAYTEVKNGRVIEVLLVPPPSTDAVSRITPNQEQPDRGLTRLRRFVVVRDNVDNGSSFEALAIKTNNSQGVAAPGVIKSHHAVIYTGTPPTIDAAERPQRMSNGHLENGMQPQAIRVMPYDKTKALDPMARLDYGDRYIFDHGVPNIRVWGRVHENSLPSLFVQFSAVWQNIHSAASGPGALGPTVVPPSSLGSVAETITPSTAAAQSATQRTQRQRAPQRAAAGSATRDLPAIGTGAITDEQMLALLRAYRTHAIREDLHWPEERLNQQQMHALALSAQTRAAYFQRITHAWADEDSD